MRITLPDVEEFWTRLPSTNGDSRSGESRAWNGCVINFIFPGKKRQEGYRPTEPRVNEWHKRWGCFNVWSTHLRFIHRLPRSPTGSYALPLHFPYRYFPSCSHETNRIKKKENSREIGEQETSAWNLKCKSLISYQYDRYSDEASHMPTSNRPLLPSENGSWTGFLPAWFRGRKRALWGVLAAVQGFEGRG